jgi:light-regulated signal transduction histidine kinase (bacteriophytochrome)
MVGKPAGILFGEHTGEGDIRKIRCHLEDNHAQDNFVATYVTKSQNELQIMISGSLLTDKEGTGYDLVVVGKDITERKAQENELQSIVIKLEQSNRELQDFAHIASHDLQEPLRKIMAFGDRLNSKFSDTLDDQGQDYLRRMRNAAERMQGLIQGLLMYSRVTTKAKPFVPVDLSLVTRDVLSDLEVRIQETGGKIETENLPAVSADPLQMRQLFQNLIGNALKFNKANEPPVVKISCHPVNSNSTDNIGSGKELYEITVEDNGIGFDEQYTSRIFGVFQRLHGRNEYEGSGIGLSICRKIVHRHGGNITAKSSPGQGAKFVITLPAAREQEEPLNNETVIAEQV